MLNEVSQQICEEQTTVCCEACEPPGRRPKAVGRRGEQEILKINLAKWYIYKLFFLLVKLPELSPLRVGRRKFALLPLEVAIHSLFFCYVFPGVLPSVVTTVTRSAPFGRRVHCVCLSDLRSVLCLSGVVSLVLCLSLSMSFFVSVLSFFLFL